MHGALYYEDSVIDYMNAPCPTKAVHKPAGQQRHDKAPQTANHLTASLKDLIKKLAKPKQ